MFIFVAILMFYGGIPILNWAQQDGNLSLEILVSNAPVKIVDLTIENKNVASGQRFFDSQQWYKELKINIQNDSGKTIRYIDFGMLFRASADKKDDIPLHFLARYGDRKNALREDINKIAIKPTGKGEIYSVPMSAIDSEVLASFIAQHGINRRHLQIQIEEIVFDDGSVWSIGSWYRIDPDNPDKLIRVTENKGDVIKDVALNSLQN